jgi:hypothetical protein
MFNVNMLPLNIQSKWEKDVHMGVVIEDYNWSFIYCIPFSVKKILNYRTWKLPIDNQKFRT